MKSDIITSVLAKMLSALFSFAVLIYTSHALGLELRGEIALFLSLALTISTFISISIENSFVSQIRKCVAKTELYITFVTSVCFLGFICFLFILFITYIVDFNFLISTPLVALAGAVTLVTKCLIGLYLVDGDLVKYNMNLIYTKFIYLLLTLLSIQVLLLSVNGVIYAYLFSQFMFVFLVFRQKSLKVRFKINKYETKLLVVNSFKIHSTTIGTLLITQVPLVIIGSLATKANVAIFDSAFQVTGILALVVSSLSPVIYSKIANSSSNESIPVTVNLLFILYLILTPVCLISWFFAGEITIILFGSDFDGVIPVLRCLLMMVWFNAMNFIVGPYWVMNNDVLKLSVIVFFLGIINSLGTYIILKDGGFIYIAYIMVLTSMITFMVNIVYLNYLRAKLSESEVRR